MTQSLKMHTAHWITITKYNNMLVEWLSTNSSIKVELLSSLNKNFTINKQLKWNLKKKQFYTIIYWCYIDKWKKFQVAQKIEKKNSWITNITKKKPPEH